MVKFNLVCYIALTCNFVLTKCDRARNGSDTDSDEEYYADEYDYDIANGILDSVETVREYNDKIFFLPFISNNIKFKYYDSLGNIALSSGSRREPSFEETNCDPNGKYAIIIHGWNESCTTREWITDLVSNLTKHRGGCIICMDYSYFSKHEYGQLVLDLPTVVQTLASKLSRMEEKGKFNPDNGFMYGFSFGAHVVFRAGKKYGHQKLKEIDACEPASPWFDERVDTDFRGSAKNVQCIHTSQYPGTYYTKGCHQNWRMGDCGVKQPGAGPPPYGSHGLCTYFYNSAFSNDFLAVRKGEQCGAGKAAATWPRKFKMGYNENRKLLVIGELFAETYQEYPWNVASDSKVIQEQPVDETTKMEPETTVGP